MVAQPEQDDRVARHGHGDALHVSLGPEAFDGLLVSACGLREPAPLEERLRVVSEDPGPFGIVFGGQLQGAGVVALGGLDIDPDRPVPGQGQVPQGLGPELPRARVPRRGGELQGRRIVGGEDLGVVLHPLTRDHLEPRGGPAVPLSPLCPRDLGVGDVSDQGVEEAVLGLALHRGASGRADQLLAGELVHGLVHLLGFALSHRGDRARPEDLADHRGVGQHGLLRLIEGVQSGGDQPLHPGGQRDLRGCIQGPGCALLVQDPPVLEQSDELLGVQRVAPCPGQDRGLDLGGEHGLLEQVADQTGRVGLREWAQVHPGGVAGGCRPRGGTFVELRAGRGHQKHRDPFGVVGDVLQEGEQRVVGPVQILEDEHRWVALGDRLQEPPPGGEVLLPPGLGSLHPEEGTQALAEPGGVGVGIGNGGVELGGGRLRGVGLQDPRLGLHDLPESPERDPVPVGQAPPLAPAHQVQPVLDEGEQFGHHPGLADPGLAHDGDQVDGGVPHAALEGPGEEVPLKVPPDQRRGEHPGEIGAEPGPGGHCVPQRDRGNLAFERHRRHGLVVEDVLGGQVGALTHRDPVHRCGSL